MQIEPANLSHIPSILSLNVLVQKLHAEAYPKLFKYPMDMVALESAWLAKLQEVEHNIFVAVVDESAVGYLWAEHVRRGGTVWKHVESSLHIHQLSVSDTCRENGVGIALIAEVEAQANKLAVDFIALDTWCFNRDALAFFEARDFSGYNLKQWKWRH